MRQARSGGRGKRPGYQETWSQGPDSTIYPGLPTSTSQCRPHLQLSPVTRQSWPPARILTLVEDNTASIWSRRRSRPWIQSPCLSSCIRSPRRPGQRVLNASQEPTPRLGSSLYQSSISEEIRETREKGDQAVVDRRQGRASCQAGAWHLHVSLPHRTALWTEHREERPAVSGEVGEQVVSPPQSKRWAQLAPAAPPWRDSSGGGGHRPVLAPLVTHLSLGQQWRNPRSPHIQGISVRIICVHRQQSVTLPVRRRQRRPKV